MTQGSLNYRQKCVPITSCHMDYLKQILIVFATLLYIVPFVHLFLSA